MTWPCGGGVIDALGASSTGGDRSIKVPFESSAMTTGLSLYVHLPYCAAVCPYCDFAKTANRPAGIAEAYVARLTEHLEAWADEPEVAGRLAAHGGFSTVFFGGGTPSLLGEGLRPIADWLAPRVQATTEVSLEANPEHVHAANLALWRELGVNRLSLGVQSFQASGLKVLGRHHSPDGARQAVAAATQACDRVNVDLIYGWPGQTSADFAEDLREAIALGVGHLSLYTLTYEAQTPMGRRVHRGVAPDADEGTLVACYELAGTMLAAAGFEHEEVSNWSLPGQSCQHNWQYWSDGSFLGVGAGAHGYLGTADGPGRRYAYGRDDRGFIRRDLRAEGTWGERFGVSEEAERTGEVWLTERIGAGLRTCRGLRLTDLMARTGRSFSPTPVLAEGLARGHIRLAGEGPERTLQLAASEWFRETAWAVELLRSLQ